MIFLAASIPSLLLTALSQVRVLYREVGVPTNVIDDLDWILETEQSIGSNLAYAAEKRFGTLANALEAADVSTIRNVGEQRHDSRTQHSQARRA